MTLEQLNELDLIALEEEFGDCIAEEVAQSQDEQALRDLRALIDRRLAELSLVPAT